MCLTISSPDKDLALISCAATHKERFPPLSCVCGQIHCVSKQIHLMLSYTKDGWSWQAYCPLFIFPYYQAKEQHPLWLPPSLLPIQLLANSSIAAELFLALKVRASDHS